jgi:SNF2 family DNA or RNA helicase
MRSKIEPYFLRRRKEDVLDELPPKRLADRWLTLTPPQAAAYERAEKKGVAYLRDLGRQITITHVLALITRLKQICNFDPQTEQSCKLDYLREAIEEIAVSGEKALVFSHFVQTIEFLRDKLSDFSPVVYKGGMSPSQKDAAVGEFTEKPDRPVMLISLKAGGLGLNLQAASWVFHYDRWWTPAAERQAEDRAHRIGQSKALMIERLMCEDTIEERIHRIQQRKQRIIDDLVEADYEDGMERL